jgi:hypothetical protein
MGVDRQNCLAARTEELPLRRPQQYRAPFTVAVVLLTAIEFRQYVLLAVRYPFTS